MTITFLGMNINVNFIDPPFQNTLTAPTTKKNNFSTGICPDDTIAKIENHDNSWRFAHNSNKIGQPATMTSVIDYANLVKGNYILFILESPHYWEYDKIEHTCLGPAQGETGIQTDSHLLEAINTSTVLSLKPELVYSIIFLNSVQYQASQGEIPINDTGRDNNWRFFWNNGFNKDLLDRINAFLKVDKDLIVVNCVTGGIDPNGLHLLVQNYLVQNKIKNLHESNHPSSWGLNEENRKIW